jgi:hypothetical protein
MVVMATYPPFKSSQFLKIILKARIKKISGMLNKCFIHIIMVAMATYFFLQFFVKNSSNQAQFCLLFLEQELKKNQEC